MGFFDKVKKTLGSKYNTESQNSNENSMNNELTDESKFRENIVNNNEETQFYDSEEMPVNEKIIDKAKSTSPVRNFKYLDYLIHSGVKEIVLDSNITLGDEEEFEYLNGIELDVDDLTIDGGGYTIDACKKTRIFYCTCKNITIKNIIFKCGSGNKGGAMYNAGNELRISKSQFIENSAQFGGAIYNKDSELNIIESSFINNNAKFGGAIRNINGMLNISESSLHENTSKKEGGSIANSNGKVIIIKSSLHENTAQDMGGSISNIRGEMKITDSTLKSNSSWKGGAVSNINATTEISKSLFIDNTSDYGGVIFNDNGNLNFNESTLNKNKAKKYGGAVHTSGDLILIKSYINENLARDGGAIYNDGGKVTVNESTLNKNVANGSTCKGGAINNNKGGRLIILDSTINNNIAKSKGSGGALYNYRSISIITKSTFNSNNATFGGFVGNKESELSIAESVFNDNCAETGGVIYNTDSELKIDKSLFKGNAATESGGAIFNEIGNSKIFSCEFINNKSQGNIILNTDALQIYNTNLKDNKSKYIVVNNNDRGNLSISNGRFIANTADESVISNSGKFCSIDKTVFENNIHRKNIVNKTNLTLISPKINDNGKTILNEGYILVKKSNLNFKSKICGEGIIEFDECIIPDEKNFDFGYLDKKIHESKTNEIILEHDICFENYEQDFYEGGIELDIDNLVIDGNGKTIDAKAKSRIFIVTADNITLKNITFKNGRTHRNYDNPLNNNGGSIKINYNSNISIENCEFINNTSEDGNGGAIHNYAGELTIAESTLQENTSNRDGGAIYNVKGKLSVIESNIDDNLAKNYGGAIFNTGMLTITNSVLTRNILTGDYTHGGAIYNYSCELSIIKSQINENTAQGGLGGAIYNNIGKFSITDSTFNDNQSKNGGAMYNEDAEFTIIDSTFKDNISRMGGAIFHNRKDLNIIKSTFFRNISLVNGGAIANIWGKLNISDSALNENMSLDSGGAVYNEDGKVTITKSRFDENIASNFEKVKKHFLDKIKTPISSASHNLEHYWGDKLLFIESRENPSPPEYQGGAIYSYGMDLFISKSSFNNNIAKGKGGAIGCLNEENLKLTDCEFKNNQEYVQELKPDEYEYKDILYRYVDNLGIKNETEKYACEIYEKAMQNDLILDMDDALIMAACLYFACRENEEPYDMKEIADATNIELRKLRRAFVIITRKLNLKIKTASPLFYIPRFSSSLKLSDQAQSKAIEIAEKGIENGIVLGKNPKGVAAAAIYLACKSVGEEIDQRRISDIVGVTQTTIRLRCNDFAALDK